MALDVRAVRAELLFASQVQPSHSPSRYQVHATITAMAVEYGTRWCAARVAQEFGDHPDTAVQRMAWARDVVADTYQKRRLP